MFDIEYKGANTVVISAKKSSLVTDPASVDSKNPVVIKDSIQLATEDRFLASDDNFKLSISYPGSYEVSDFSINGFAEKRHIDSDNSKKSVVYNIEVSGVKIGLLGNVGPEVSDEQLENIGLIDILIIPVGGGGYTLDATSAANIVRRSDAKVIIPVHYAEDGVNYEVPQSSFELFAKELGCDIEKTSKYKVKSLANIPEKTTIVQIERSK